MTHRLLFDLDETLYIGDIVKVAVKKLIEEGDKGLDPDLSGVQATDINFSNFPERLVKKIFELFNDPIEAAINKTPLCGAYPFLYYITQVLQEEIGFLTARPKQLHEVTRYCLFRDFPDIKWTLEGFANDTLGHKQAISKSVFIKSWRPTHYFDDYAPFCSEAVDAGVKNVYLIHNKHTGWNKGITNTSMIPIKSILELDLRHGL
jgi:hypothetical protein